MKRPPEKNQLRLGLLPLADAAPLVVAKYRGLFARHGLHVELSLEHSWAAIRDKVATGILDGAQMLAPMTVAASLGLDGLGVPMLTALSLNLNGNAITVSSALFSRMQRQAPSAGNAIGWAHALRLVLEADRRAGRPPPVFAHVYPFSTHHYELRLWLASAGIDPDHDVQLCVVPPPRMIDELTAGRIDGYCVGAPWGDLAVRRGLGMHVASKHEIWNNSPEKVLGVTREWADRHPGTHVALVAALIEGARWLDQPQNRAPAAKLMVEGGWARADRDCMEAALLAKPGGIVFQRHAATFPWRSHGIWFALQMMRAGQAGGSIDLTTAARTAYRTDIYREAAALVGQPCPPSDFKSEGGNAEPWLLQSQDGVALELGADRLLDGAKFDPWAPLEWLRAQSWTPPPAQTAATNMAR